MNRQGFFKALGVLAKTPSMQKYLNVLKPSAVREGIEQAATSGMDFFNLAIKKVVGEGKEIESTLTTKKYVHPDRPDIFVEVDMSTGNANVGLVDPDRGAFAYTDMMKREDLIKSLEDEGLGSMGAVARADEIENMRKAEKMRNIAKNTKKNKRQAMIDAYRNIIRNKNQKADGGEVSLTVIEMPDISGAGVETLFKKR